MDKRWKRLGALMVNDAMRVQAGERVMIAVTEPESFDLAKCVYESVVKAGGFPQVQLLSEEFKHSLLRYGSEEQISWVPEMEAWGMEWADVYLGLRGAHNLGELSDIDVEKVAKQQAAMGVISDGRWNKTRWSLIRIPTDAFAVQAKCDFDTILDMFFDACFVDLKADSKKWDRWVTRLNKGKQMRVVGVKTDLSFSIEGRNWILALGDINIPDGEIYTAPVTDTIDGTIYFENPGVLGGRLLNDLTFTWKKGVLVSATSSNEQAFLDSIIRDNPGADTIGEFAMGTNREMTRFCNDILFDEKIYGTVHIALGRAYKNAGGTNESSIHWDIVKDTRLEGSVVYLDGEPILKDGEFLL